MTNTLRLFLDIFSYLYYLPCVASFCCYSPLLISFKKKKEAVFLGERGEEWRHKHRCFLNGIVGRVFCSEVLVCVECS